MRILVVAADPMELRAMPSRPDLALRANGAGANRAAAAVESAVREFQPDAVISTGFCGALAPEMRAGDIVVATEVQAGLRRFPVLQPQTYRDHHSGVVLSIDHVVSTAAEKVRLRASGA